MDYSAFVLKLQIISPSAVLESFFVFPFTPYRVSSVYSPSSKPVTCCISNSHSQKSCSHLVPLGVSILHGRIPAPLTRRSPKIRSTMLLLRITAALPRAKCGHAGNCRFLRVWLWKGSITEQDTPPNVWFLQCIWRSYSHIYIPLRSCARFPNVTVRRVHKMAMATWSQREGR